MKARTGGVLAALLLTLSTAARAQTDTTAVAPEPFDRSIALNVGGGSNTIGLWQQASPGLARGIEIGAGFSTSGDDDNESTSRSIFIAPSLKLYSAPAFSVASEPGAAFRPFLLLGVFGQYEKIEISSDEGPFEGDATRTSFGGRAALGLDWHPVPRVSIGGYAGVVGGVQREKQEVEDAEAENDGWFIQTFDSGIVLQLFF